MLLLPVAQKVVLHPLRSSSYGFDSFDGLPPCCSARASKRRPSTVLTPLLVPLFSSLKQAGVSSLVLLEHLRRLTSSEALIFFLWCGLELVTADFLFSGVLSASNTVLHCRFFPSRRSLLASFPYERKLLPIFLFSLLAFALLSATFSDFAFLPYFCSCL